MNLKSPGNHWLLKMRMDVSSIDSWGALCARVPNKKSLRRTQAFFRD